jgi:uncharacterized protein YmfQ (DUF2313 family)
MDLWPRGVAWTRAPSSNRAKFTGVIAQERMSRHERKLTLLEKESVPTSAVELLGDWEQAVSLPDPCRAVPGSLAERWAALADIFFADHPPTPANMVTWAAQAGWNISIREQLDFVAGVSMAGEAVGESDFAWVVSIHDQVVSFFRAEQSASGDLLYSFPDITTLECVLRRAAPGHTQIYFIVP